MPPLSATARPGAARARALGFPRSTAARIIARVHHRNPMHRIATKIVLAATLLAASVAAHALDKVVFATNWKAQAAHGGFYQARGRRHVQELRPRRGDPPGRPAGQQPPAAARRPHRLPDDGQPAAQLRQRQERRAGDRGGVDVPEGSAGADRASGRRLREVRGPGQGARGLHRQGRAVLVVAVAQGRLRVQGRVAAPVQLQRRPVPGRQAQPAAGLRGGGAHHDRQGRRLQARGVPAGRPRLQHLLHDHRGAHRHRQEQARPRQALRRGLHHRLEQLPVRRPQGRRRADQAGQPRDDRRPASRRACS